jgi:PD-(D/E)XK nuclease superfamily
MLEAVAGTRPKPMATSAYTQMIYAKGNEHEREYRDRLVAQGRTVEEVVHERRDWQAGAARTEELMRAGADVIYSYEAVDTKLARTQMLPHHALQLCFYAAALSRVQGEWPMWVHVELGSGERESILVHEIGSYARHAKEGMQRAVAANGTTEPIPCDHCDFCEFRSVCTTHWETVDHLTRVAGLHRAHMPLLAAAGVTTLTGLATLPAHVTVPDLRPDVLGALTQQGRLQLAAVEGATPPYELLPVEEGKGSRCCPSRAWATSCSISRATPSGRRPRA